MLGPVIEIEEASLGDDSEELEEESLYSQETTENFKERANEQQEEQKQSEDKEENKDDSGEQQEKDDVEKADES